jgi:hypothetical protein
MEHETRLRIVLSAYRKNTAVRYFSDTRCRLFLEKKAQKELDRATGSEQSSPSAR